MSQYVNELIKSDLKQFQIQFENMYSNIGNCWSKYKYPALGNILSWLYVYGTFDMAENSIIGDGTVKYHGEQIATYYMDDNLEMPVFEFIMKYDWVQFKQEIFLEGLKNETTKEIIQKYK
jgi:hypothetical protein